MKHSTGMSKTQSSEIKLQYTKTEHRMTSSQICKDIIVGSSHRRSSAAGSRAVLCYWDIMRCALRFWMMVSAGVALPLWCSACLVACERLEKAVLLLDSRTTTMKKKNEKSRKRRDAAKMNPNCN
ncbi:putative transcription factor [Sesbania bispinosa]|nr:putative transcription factor [Sesbania bispinosa]